MLVNSQKFEKAFLIPYLNVERALLYMNGNHDLFNRSLVQFIQTQSDFVLRLRMALEKNEKQNISLLIHIFKGQTALIGAQDITNGADEIERVLSSETVDSILLEKLLNSLDQQLNRIYLDLANIEPTSVKRSNRLQSSKNNKVDTSYFREELKTMIALNDANMLRFIRTYPIEFRITFGSKAESIREAIENFDFQTAHKEIFSVIQSN